VKLFESKSECLRKKVTSKNAKKDGMMLRINQLRWAKIKFRNGPIIVAETTSLLARQRVKFIRAFH
jgi:hypothetical protein